MLGSPEAKVVPGGASTAYGSFLFTSEIDITISICRTPSQSDHDALETASAPQERGRSENPGRQRR